MKRRKTSRPSRKIIQKITLTLACLWMTQTPLMAEAADAYGTNDVNKNYETSNPVSSGDADGYTLTIKDGNTFDNAYGGRSDGGSADGNKINISAGTINRMVYGGLSKGPNGSASNNEVIVSDGEIEWNVYGGFSSKGNGSASNNTVIVSGGEIKRTVWGGYSNDGRAANNTVIISGGIIGGNVYGGYDRHGSVEGNRIIINGTPIFGGGDITANVGISSRDSGHIYIGYGSPSDPNDIDSKPLPAALTKPINVHSIGGADTLHIGLIGGDALSAGAVIEVNNIFTNKLDLSDLAFAAIPASDHLEIIKSGSSLPSNVTMPTDNKVPAGTTRAYGLKLIGQTVGLDGTQYVIKLDGNPTVQEQTRHTLVNAEAGVAALLAGNSLIDKAIDGVSSDTIQAGGEWGGFAYMGGGESEYETGSSVTTRTFNGAVGVGRQLKRKNGALNLGVFYEYGSGSYVTKDEAGRGNGKVHFMGGGIFAKNELPKGWYYEGGLRLGRMTNDGRNILHDALGNAYGYNEKSTYWGFVLGGGKVIPLEKGRSVDVYGKYYFNHLGSISFNAGGQYDLDAVNSSLLRLGARYTFWKEDVWSGYGGLAYEYEFDGKAGGFADGLAIRLASLQGSSALFEVGLRREAAADNPWSIDLNISAHAGERKGIMGGARVSYSF